MNWLPVTAALTTVRRPIVSMARAAARKLIGDVVGAEATEAQLAELPSMLVKRALGRAAARLSGNPL